MTSLRTTVVLTLAVAVIAMAASSPLSHSTPVNAASASTPTTALFLLLAGAGVIVLAGLVAVLWPGRRKRDDEPELEPQQFEVPWLTKALAIALPLALAGAIVAAALTGVRKPASGAPFGGGLARSPASRALSHSAPGKTGFVLPGWLPWTVLALVVAAAMLGLGLLLARRRTVAEEPADTAGTTAAVTAAIEALDAHADPRSAVIAAYAAMERTLAAHGLSRAPTEAPREYLRHVLSAGRAREQDVRTLTALFEEARFSTHPIPERIRDAASAALRSVRMQLGTDTRT